MKVKIQKTFFTFLFFVFIAVASNLQYGDDLFVVPDLIKPNVEFWIKIYTDVSLDEGLLHDRDYPMIIYSRVKIGATGERGESRIIASEKSKAISIIQRLRECSHEELSEGEKVIYELFKKYATQEALQGAEERIRFQRGQKERFRLGLERSTEFLDTIRSIFVSFGIPERIIYLPHVESSFDKEAYSRVGAAGMWQFMRSSAQRYMKINYLIDERRDPIISAVAAAKMLKENYNVLGSWPLAITAYNHGLYGMKRAVSTLGSNDIEVIIAKHESPTFKFASKNFYSCFVAASYIAQNHERYFQNLNFRPKYSAISVKLPFHVRPAVLAKYLNIDEKVIRELNPALRPVVFQHQRLIPAEYVLNLPDSLQPDAVQLVLKSIPTDLVSSKPQKSHYHTVMSGETLYSIAKKYGVSLQALAAENNIGKLDRIVQGQVLQLPIADAALSKADTGAKESKMPVPPAEPIMAQNQSESAKSKVVTVSKDTLLSPLSAANVSKPRRADTPFSAVPQKVIAPSKAADTAAEFIPDSLKKVAMAIAGPPLVPVPSKVKITASMQFDAAIYQLDIRPGESANRAIIKVGVDETIGHYADWLGVSARQIRELNNIDPQSSIRIGRSLIIPVKSQEDLTKFVQARLEYHMAIEEDFYSRYNVVDVKPKIIKRGESIWQICNEAEQIPLWLVKKLNPLLEIENMQPGTQIWLPIIAERVFSAENPQADLSGFTYQYFFEPMRPSRSFQMLCR